MIEMMRSWRNVLEDLRALSWRLPWVRPPKQIGVYVRYVGSVDSAAILDRLVRKIMRRAALGGVRVDHVQAIARPPSDPGLWDLDPLSQLGSIGVKADVVARL